MEMEAQLEIKALYVVLMSVGSSCGQKVTVRVLPTGHRSAQICLGSGDGSNAEEVLEQEETGSCGDLSGRGHEGLNQGHGQAMEKRVPARGVREVCGERKLGWL